MSVTVVGRWHLPADQADGFIVSARQQLEARTGAPRARRTAQVFQAADDAGALLYVSEWSDRTAFEAHRAEAKAGAVEAAIRDGGEFLICERELFFGNYTYRTQVTGCGIIEAPPGSGDAVRALLVPNGRWVYHGAPGLVYYAVYREVTHSHRFVVVHGWQSEAALRTVRDRRSELQWPIEAIGGSIIPFTGYERASTDIL